MQAIGKSDSTGKAFFRITADGEVLTKVNAASYVHSDQAPHTVTGGLPSMWADYMDN